MANATLDPIMKEAIRTWRKPLTPSDSYRLRNIPTRVRGWKAEILSTGRVKRFLPVITSQLEAVVYRGCTYHADGSIKDFTSKENLGVISRRVVTTAGVAKIATQWSTSSATTFNWHESGTGSTAENITDTAMGTVITITRPAGTQSTPSSGAYRTVATINYTSTNAVTEQGVFDAVTTGVLLDRSVFSAINVVNLDSINFTYTITFASGG